MLIVRKRDRTAETLAEENARLSSTTMALTIVAIAVLALLIGYFAWYLPGRQAPVLMDRETHIITPSAPPQTVVPSQSPPIVIPGPPGPQGPQGPSGPPGAPGTVPPPNQEPPLRDPDTGRTGTDGGY
jgi:hypothetical protein